jgi:SpoVK/Ycf46/Vps4 family AAA+-type ATPase
MNRLIPEFLSQVDGVETAGSSILLLGATNRPWDMDEAALRPGRFGERIYVGLPDEAARRLPQQEHLKGIPCSDDVDCGALSAQTEGYSGADLVGVVARATDFPYSREIATGAGSCVNPADMAAAIAEIRPSVTAAMLKRYAEFARKGN